MPTSDRRGRPRRQSAVDALPTALVEFFQHKRPGSTTWETLIYPDSVLLPQRWRTWKQAHPQARPPQDFAWLEELGDERHPSPESLREARKCYLRGRMK